LGGGGGSSVAGGSGGGGSAGSGAGGGGVDGGVDGGDVLQVVFNAVDQNQLHQRLLEMTGGVPVTVGGQTFSITERWSVAGKTNFRAYWKQYFTNLGMTVNETAVSVGNQTGNGGPPGETSGHNVEAILPGRSTDTVVLLAHYDSIGIQGQETQNPAADDAASGLAAVMEAARIFSQYPNRGVTVRFVASDYEEETLAADRGYATALTQLAQQGNFKVILMVNHDQMGWSCWSENRCASGAPARNSAFWLINCSGDSHNYNYPDLLQGVTVTATKYSTIKVQSSCDNGDDQVAFWEKGVPAIEFDEFSWDRNPHYDDTGNDTMAHIDLSYFTQIVQVAVTYEAGRVGLSK
jgi:Zn-dependent M28 family amino/carboxypeptidase